MIRLPLRTMMSRYIDPSPSILALEDTNNVYYILRLLESRRICSIFLAFRVPSQELHVDYSIIQLSNPSSIKMSDRTLFEPLPDAGTVIRCLQSDEVSQLDRYCDQQALCILKRYRISLMKKHISLKKRSDSEVKALMRLRHTDNVVKL